MRYSSVINYYQTVIFYHNVRGSPVTNWTDPMLSQTVKGIKNMETTPEDVKDPVTEKHLKGRYHESITNVRYAVVSLTTVRQEWCFALSERICTSSLVTSRISREGRGVTTYRNLPRSFVTRLL